MKATESDARRRVGFAVLGLCTMLSGGVAQADGHPEPQNNIVETAAAAGQFDTLIAAARAAGLVDALTGEGPLTVFAPTDEAFAALPAGTVDTLLQPENQAQLERILKYHVVAGTVGSSQLANGAAVKMLSGDLAGFTRTGQGFSIEGARITIADIKASNGIVHVIDRVILPPDIVAAVTPESLIEMAINEGVPQFNSGNHAATVAIYRITAQSLMSFADLTQAEINRLARGLLSSQRASSMAEAAWELRYALDEVSESLRQRRVLASR